MFSYMGEASESHDVEKKTPHEEGDSGRNWQPL